MHSAIHHNAPAPSKTGARALLFGRGGRSHEGVKFLRSKIEQHSFTAKWIAKKE